MQAYVIPEWGIDKLKIEERDIPEPKKYEVLIKLKSASLNYRDLLIVEGKYNPKMKLPVIPLSDGVGEVVALGEGVEKFRLKERVSPIFAPNWLAGEPTYEAVRKSLGGPLDGTLCEYMVMPESALVKVPEHLTDEEAATLPCAAVTAWSALFVYGNLKPGQYVVVLGTGGVSVFALQFAKLAGARVIVTSSSDEKLAKMEKLGADFFINYQKKPEWSKEVRKITQMRGADYIIEVGGANTLAESLKAVRMGGTISLIGVLAGSTGELSLLPILMQNVRVQGILVGSREAFEKMNEAISTHKLKPVVDQIYNFRDFPEALRHLKEQKHTGKICIKIA